MKKKVKIIILLFITLTFLVLYSYNLRIKDKNETRNLRENDEIVKVQIIDKYNNIEKIHENCKEEKYELVDIIIDGIYYYNVGIRTKGSSIYTYLKINNSDRHSYKIKLDYMNEKQKYKRKYRVLFKY